MVHIAILGFGVVGSGVYELSLNNKDVIAQRANTPINVKYIKIRNSKHHLTAEPLFTTEIADIINDNSISIVVEVIGGVHDAYEYTKAALKAGKHVVTANKELVATYGRELANLADKHQVKYLYEASVGGGMPVIRPLRQCLAANKITEIFGILNGTTNYILTKMAQEGESFQDALANAQQKGYAESDPTDDIEGIDTVRKLSILASLAFGKDISATDIFTKGIKEITQEDIRNAEKDNCKLKLIAHGKLIDGEIICKVEPLAISEDSPLYNVDNGFNGIVVRAEPVGEVMFYGLGAGKEATASAIMADVIDIVRKGV